MSDERYNIVFKGELARAFELADVKKNIGQLFKISGPSLDVLFSGKAVVLKKNLDFATASKYRGAIKKAGARVDLVLLEEEISKPAIKDDSGDAPKEEKATLPKDNNYEEGLSLSATGGNLLRLDEQKPEPRDTVVVPDFTLREGDGNLIEADELQRAEPLNVNTDDLSLLPAGSDVLAESERKAQDATDVATEHLSIADPGVRLSKPSPPPPAPPDTSGITLE